MRHWERLVVEEMAKAMAQAQAKAKAKAMAMAQAKAKAQAKARVVAFRLPMIPRLEVCIYLATSQKPNRPEQCRQSDQGR